MKKLILVFSVLCSGFAFGQNYHYQFKIDNVTNLAEAKEATVLFREKFEVFPIFNDSTDTFDFTSTSIVDQSELQSLLTPQSYLIIEFSRIKLNDEIEEK